MDWHYRTWHCQPLLFLATLLSTCYFSCELDDWKYQNIMRENGLASFDSIPTPHLLNTCIPTGSVIIFKGERSPTISSDPATICYPSSFLWYLAVVSQVKQWIRFIQNGPRNFWNLRKKSNLGSNSLGFGADFQSDFSSFPKKHPYYLKQSINFQKKNHGNHQPPTNGYHPTNQWRFTASRLQAASLGYQFCPLQTQARWIQQVRICLVDGIQWPWPLEKTIKEKQFYIMYTNLYNTLQI